jgi:hypothetical protein
LKELIYWCIYKFEKELRVIQLQGESPISLSPSTLKRILKLPKLKTTFESAKSKDFLKTNEDVFELLWDYLKDSTVLPEDPSNI